MGHCAHFRWLAALAAGAALAGCAVSLSDSANVEGGQLCPDPRRPLPFPVARPDCWSDAQWDRYLELEAQRARSDGDYARYRDRF